MENRKISRGINWKKLDQFLEGGIFFLPQENGWKFSPLGGPKAVPCCLKEHRTSHIATKGQKAHFLSTHKHLKQV